MKKNLLALVGIFLFNSYYNWAQCSMYELTLEQKARNSSNIVEGKVIGQNSWESPDGLIFTSNVIQVLKEFKGNTNAEIIEIITEGGTVGDKMQTVEPNVHLHNNAHGIFLLITSEIKNHQNSLHTTYKCYGDAQGFIEYDLVSKTATTPFNNYNNIKTELYNTLVTIIGKTYTSIKNFDIENLPVISLSMPKSGGITNFSPTTISGGTYSVLTINGSGFGVTRGNSEVKFKDPDNGGSTYKRAEVGHYVSWSDTQIKLKVPVKAGTGTIQVVVGSNTYVSSGTLTIPYTETNTTDTVNLPSYTALAKIDPVTNGIIWHMNTTFDANSNAKSAFNRAMQTWMDATCVNWSLGNPTSVDVRKYDSVSVVRYDIGNELSSGTLARCYYYWVKCTDTLWVVAELDMVVDGSTTWQYGPTTPTGIEYDFESVMLHELGHGHQLNHVINTNDIMHYNLTSGITKRTLNTNNITAGNEVMARSTTHTTCTFFSPMTASTSCLIGIDNPEKTQTNLLMFPNPSSGKLTISLNEGSSIESVTIYSQLGIVMKEQYINGLTQTQIDLTNLSAGMYNVMVKTKDKSYSQNIIIN